MRDKTTKVDEFWSRPLISVTDKEDVGLGLRIEEDNPLTELVIKGFFGAHDAVHKVTKYGFFFPFFLLLLLLLLVLFCMGAMWNEACSREGKTW